LLLVEGVVQVLVTAEAELLVVVQEDLEHHPLTHYLEQHLQ
jgi:hypothetical protein